MSRSDEERITDIVEAAAEISRVVANGKRAWDTDHLSRLAVERLLEIIGESARAMTPPGRDAFPEVPWTTSSDSAPCSPTTTTELTLNKCGSSRV